MTRCHVGPSTASNPARPETTSATDIATASVDAHAQTPAQHSDPEPPGWPFGPSRDRHRRGDAGSEPLTRVHSARMPPILAHGMTRAATGLPARNERIRELRGLIGTADASVKQMTVGIRGITAMHYDRHVMPLVREHWPEVLREPFAVKMRLAACDLYATAPYTVLFCAPNRPVLVRVVTDLANKVDLPFATLGALSKAAMAVIGRATLAREHRRIILIAAFIAVVDHAFDHCMDEPPVERGRKMRALLDGEYVPDTPPLRLTRALQLGMAHELDAEERPHFDRAMRRLTDWVDSEVAGMTGVKDASGLGHRLAGVEGTIDGLLFPVYRYAGEGARRWMYDVSLFIQMLDDYIDYEADAATERNTPVIAGEWTFAEISNTWRRSVTGLEDLTRAGGLGSPRYVRFIREAYVLMILEVLEGMSSGIAD